MLRIAFGVFVVLHGLVHLLYWGQSARQFELQPGMAWPDGAWAFSRWLEHRAVRMVAGMLLVVAAAGFVAGGVGILARQGWWRAVIVGVAAWSTLIYALCWDGVAQRLHDKGAIGIAINAAIAGVALAA